MVYGILSNKEFLLHCFRVGGSEKYFSHMFDRSSTTFTELEISPIKISNNSTSEIKVNANYIAKHSPA